jgi:hypothetical protein
MYRSAADYASGCLVGLHSGARSDASDFRAVVDSFRALNEHAVGPMGFILLVIDAGDHIPTAPFRRELAELRRRGRPHRLAFITQSTMARAAITAIDWLQAPRANQQVKAWVTVGEGVAWLELEHGAALPALLTLYATLRGTSAGAGLDSRSRAGPSPDASPRK